VLEKMAASFGILVSTHKTKSNHNSEYHKLNHYIIFSFDLSFLRFKRRVPISFHSSTVYVISVVATCTHVCIVHSLSEGYCLPVGEDGGFLRHFGNHPQD
jgi:hypothetical protein